MADKDKDPLPKMSKAERIEAVKKRASKAGKKTLTATATNADVGVGGMSKAFFALGVAAIAASRVLEGASLILTALLLSFWKYRLPAGTITTAMKNVNSASTGVMVSSLSWGMFGLGAVLLTQEHLVKGSGFLILGVIFAILKHKFPETKIEKWFKKPTDELLNDLKTGSLKFKNKPKHFEADGDD